jgi:ubiquinone/menaquinone biosynthesis C-methylase UbiE
VKPSPRPLAPTIALVPTEPLIAQREKAEVREFWEQRPCGSSHADAPEGTTAYFDQVERRRYELEPFIEQYADFEGARGQHVLEIGAGLGTDLVRFARAGARVTAIDLTEHSAELVRRRLELEGLQGDIRVADAENLPFADASFDRVYSWGVLHHTPDTTRAVDEAIRVLRPGGRLCVMLYGRHSWVAFALWIRHALLALRPRRRLSDVLASQMESQGTKAYTLAELRGMFAVLEDLEVDPVVTAYDRRVAGPVTRLFAPRFGWFLVVRGRRALADSQ